MWMLKGKSCWHHQTLVGTAFRNNIACFHHDYMKRILSKGNLKLSPSSDSYTICHNYITFGQNSKIP